MNLENLPQYFLRGIILPTVFYSNRAEDVQDRFSDSILISKKKWTDVSNCSLEVILTDSESNQLIPLTNNFYSYNGVIPISRIKSITFLNADRKTNILWDINSGVGFIPESLAKVEEFDERNSASISELDNKSVNPNSIEALKKSVKYYDHILGGFAFMKLGGETFMNYSQNYFSTLSYFNKLIEEQIQDVQAEGKSSFSNKFIGLFTKEESTWTKWRNAIFGLVDKDFVQQAASSERIRIESKFNNIRIDSIDKDSFIYDLAVLATYGERKNKSAADLVSDIYNGNIDKTKREEISLLFGLNSGYSKLRNRYKVGEKDKLVKFKLDSKLDYYTIESVYQSVFNKSRASYSFPYLDAWCPTAKTNLSVKGYETYQVLDKVVIAKKKHQFLSLEYLEELFQKYSASEVFSTLTASINKWLPPFAHLDEEKGSVYFEQILRKPISLWYKSIFKQIESDYKENLYAEKQNIEADLIESFELEKYRLTKRIEELEDALNTLKSQQLPSSSISEENESLPPTEERLKENQNPDDVAKEVSTPNVVEWNLRTNSVDEELEEKIESNAAKSSEKSDDYDSMTLTELKEVAKKLGISSLSKYNSKNKDVLIKAIRNTPLNFFNSSSC
ncbi:hypothetical protein ABID22_003831 [Pontibacter aydingkolensis]|uniref:2-Component system ADP-ribosyltransferase domain-containing protein n=1 Tax=Pontibacter aydingkolensis TaxID=1911536 RepID=A0ABS7CZ80_9BACT|nr:Rho termination factor N-terminal domain-containing protein [Pontibacter aydingkolensis]MBW7469129.1 hypothetical protein [Pontibacter aydingkolensis]